jgi:hypothetical protein
MALRERRTARVITAIDPTPRAPAASGPVSGSGAVAPVPPVAGVVDGVGVVAAAATWPLFELPCTVFEDGLVTGAVFLVGVGVEAAATAGLDAGELAEGAALAVAFLACS